MAQEQVALDAIDVKILEALQADAGRSIGEIATQVNLSHNACWRRIKLLEEADVIRGRVALLNAKRIGCGITVFVSLTAGEHTDKWLETFSERVKRMPEVVEFYRLTGDIDYLIKLQIPDIESYDQVYKDLIHTVKLRDVSAAFSMEELKHTHALPLPAGGSGRKR